MTIFFQVHARHWRHIIDTFVPCVYFSKNRQWRLSRKIFKTRSFLIRSHSDCFRSKRFQGHHFHSSWFSKAESKDELAVNAEHVLKTCLLIKQPTDVCTRNNSESKNRCFFNWNLWIYSSISVEISWKYRVLAGGKFASFSSDERLIQAAAFSPKQQSQHCEFGFSRRASGRVSPWLPKLNIQSKGVDKFAVCEALRTFPCR